MVILNQVVGVGGFSIGSNLRLIIIAAIFIGIVAVLLYIKFARSGERTNGRNVGKAKAGEDIAESAEGTEEVPVVNSEIVEDKIKKSEADVITKFAEVIKDVRAEIDTKVAAEVEDIKAEFATKIEQLISKIDEREKEVVNKIEDVIDAKVQEAFYKMSDKIDVALHTQKSSTASVLEKLVDSLRTEEVQTGSLASVKAENGVDERSAKDNTQGSEATDSSKIEKALKLNDIEWEPAGVSGTNKLQEEKTFVSSDISEEIIENTVDFDMQESLEEGPVGLSSRDKSNVSVDEDVAPTEIKEEESEVQPENKADVELEKNEQIASPGKNEGNVSERAAGDFDMQAFLDAEPVSISSSGESNVVPEEIQEEELKEPSEDNTNVELDDMVTGGMVGDSADFDIQEFLDELENLPSENDSEAEK